MTSHCLQRKPAAAAFLVMIAYCFGVYITFRYCSGWNARQTCVLALTGLVLIWYTYETSALRHIAVAQRELQLRPFVLLQPVEGGFELRNLGPGAALNVAVDDVELSREEEILIRFSGAPVVLPAGDTAPVDAESFRRGRSWEDFFNAALHPEYASFEISTTVRFQDTEFTSLVVRQRLKPGHLEITHIERQVF